jgi:hypothetical protein
MAASDEVGRLRWMRCLVELARAACHMCPTSMGVAYLEMMHKLARWDQQHDLSAVGPWGCMCMFLQFLWSAIGVSCSIAQPADVVLENLLVRLQPIASQHRGGHDVMY